LLRKSAEAARDALAALLWVGWFGFDAGSNLEANAFAARVLLNMFLATAAAVCGNVMTQIALSPITRQALESWRAACRTRAFRTPELSSVHWNATVFVQLRGRASGKSQQAPLASQFRALKMSAGFLYSRSMCGVAGAAHSEFA
jgi:hypothetical protein